MKTVILDDDPTGTQSACGVHVLLTPTVEGLRRVLESADSVYVLTNSRALTEEAAVALVAGVREMGLRVAADLGEDVQFVLRGDSTLRGHVFAETEVFLDGDPAAVMLFVPAFPDGGRVTVGGMHYVTLDGNRVPAHETEFAEDPVFPFAAGRLVDYVAEKSARRAVPADLALVRAGGLVDLLVDAPNGSVVVPDAEDASDIRAIAAAVQGARERGRSVLVRSASPLAAALAGVESEGLLSRPLLTEPSRAAILVACGSHTAGAGAQLDALDSMHAGRIVLSTEDALTDPPRIGDEADRARAALRGDGIAVVTTERVRSSEHNTLDHGERVMNALTSIVRASYEAADVVIAKGGITSAEVARVGLGAETAEVLGQVIAGVSAWRLTAADGRSLLYIVVPGNVGSPDAIVEVIHAVGADPDRFATSPQ